MYKKFYEESVALYTDHMKEKGSPMDKCVGFVYCTNIWMDSPGRIYSLPRVYYSRHKRMPSLVYHTVTILNGQIFSL